MNAPIVRLYGFLLLLFALLVGFTSNWAVFKADDLKAEQANKRPLLEQQKIKRGDIRSRDGEVLAVSKSVGKGESRRFVRDYPTGALFGNPVGYDFIDQRTGIERSENDVLVGEENEFASLLEQLRGVTEEGSDLTTTLDAGAQQLATQMLAGRPGAVVAIEPKTGAIRTMVSVPGFDPNTIPDQLSQLNKEGSGSPLVNRVTQFPYPPGSTMKVVTAAAALDSGKFTPDDTVNGDTGIEISGVPLENFAGESFGQITLTDALTNSVNTAWAQVAEQIGGKTYIDYMKRFGFFSKPEFDYPPEQIRASGVYDGNRLLDNPDQIDIGRVAIGQERLLATPLQMALVAETVANGGVQMRPTFLEKVTDPDGRVTDELDPHEVRRVISAETARELTEMMVNVTQEGTAAGLRDDLGGVTFAGKTGTAERNNEGLNQPWFMMFAPADDPQIAVVATVETCQGCFGGEVAGPIATAVAQELLNG